MFRPNLWWAHEKSIACQKARALARRLKTRQRHSRRTMGVRTCDDCTTIGFIANVDGDYAPYIYWPWLCTFVIYLSLLVHLFLSTSDPGEKSLKVNPPGLKKSGNRDQRLSEGNKSSHLGRPFLSFVAFQWPIFGPSLMIRQSWQWRSTFCPSVGDLAFWKLSGRHCRLPFKGVTCGW